MLASELPWESHKGFKGLGTFAFDAAVLTAK